MFKLIVLISLLVFIGLAHSAPLEEAEEVKEGMESALSRGLKTFGGGAGEEEEKPKQKVFSHYTKGIKALGGGKPSLFEQYRKHHYAPIAPSVLPREFEVSEKMTPSEAAKIYVPSAPLQYTSDRMHI